MQNSYGGVHDHKLELEENCILSNEALRDINYWQIENPKISTSEIISRVKMLSQSIDKEGNSLYLHLSHLAVLNALKIIKCDVMY